MHPKNICSSNFEPPHGVVYTILFCFCLARHAVTGSFPLLDFPSVGPCRFCYCKFFLLSICQLSPHILHFVACHDRILLRGGLRQTHLRIGRFGNTCSFGCLNSPNRTTQKPEPESYTLERLSRVLLVWLSRRM